MNQKRQHVCRKIQIKEEEEEKSTKEEEFYRAS